MTPQVCCVDTIHHFIFLSYYCIESSDSLPTGIFVNVAILIFLQVVAQVNHFGIIIPCWIVIILSSLVPKGINVNPFWDDDMFVLIIFVATSLIFSVKSQRNLIKAVNLIKTENEKMMMETRMNDMRLLIGNISHDLRTPVRFINACIFSVF